MQHATLGIVGAGHIGGTVAHLAALKQLGHIVLFDVVPGMAQGKALDLSQIAMLENHDIQIRGTENYHDLKNCDVVIVTAGFPRKPGMSRDDLLEKNARVIQEVGKNLKIHCPQAFVIVVTNPLDAMVWVMQEATGFPPAQVAGMAGALDSSRFCSFLAQEFSVCVEDVQAMVLGGHGDAMVPLIRYSTVAGIPLPDLVKMGWITAQRVDEIVERTRKGGGEIVSLLQTGSAFYTPATCALTMAESYLKDRKRVLPCAVLLEGAYGVHGIHAGVPVVIGAKGVERVIELPLTAAEMDLFQKSVDGVRNLIDTIQQFDQKQ